jgi:hypothetical protein
MNTGSCAMARPAPGRIFEDIYNCRVLYLPVFCKARKIQTAAGGPMGRSGLQALEKVQGGLLKESNPCPLEITSQITYSQDIIR